MTFPAILIHGLCTDPESFPQPCIYCHLDEDLVDLPSTNNGSDDDEEETTTSSIRFIPASKDDRKWAFFVLLFFSAMFGLCVRVFRQGCPL